MKNFFLICITLCIFFFASEAALAQSQKNPHSAREDERDEPRVTRTLTQPPQSLNNDEETPRGSDGDDSESDDKDDDGEAKRHENEEEREKSQREDEEKDNETNTGGIIAPPNTPTPVLSQSTNTPQLVLRKIANDTYNQVIQAPIDSLFKGSTKDFYTPGKFSKEATQGSLALAVTFFLIGFLLLRPAMVSGVLNYLKRSN